MGLLGHAMANLLVVLRSARSPEEEHGDRRQRSPQDDGRADDQQLLDRNRFKRCTTFFFEIGSVSGVERGLTAAGDDGHAGGLPARTASPPARRKEATRWPSTNG
jgi:hypothetical protein